MEPSKEDLREQKQAIVRGLAIINSLNLAVVLLVAALALAAVLMARRAQENAEKLWDASVTQARASRFGGEIGWKSRALATIRAASEVKPSLALRNEAIAAISTLDITGAMWVTNRPNDHSLAFAPDLSRAAAGGVDGIVRVVEFPLKAEMHRFEMPGVVESLVFDEHGQWLAARSTGGELRAWELPSGREILKARVAHDGSTRSLMAWAGEQLIATAAGGALAIFDLRSNIPQKVEIGGDAETLATDETGQKVLYSLGADIIVSDLKGNASRKFTAPSHVTSLAASGSENAFAAGAADHKVYLWRHEAGDGPEVLEGHSGVVFRVSFGGRLLASCAFGGTTRVWEVRSGAPLLATESLFITQMDAAGYRLGCSRTKSRFGVARVFSDQVTESLKLPQDEENAVFEIEMLDHEQALLVRNSGLQLVNMQNGEVRQVTTSRRARGGALLGTKQLLTSSLDGLQLWSFPLGMAGATLLETIPVKQGLAYEMIHLARDQRRVLARIGFQGAVLFNLEERKTESVFNVPNIGNGQVSPDGKWVAIGTFHGAGTKVFSRDGTLAREIGGRDASVRFSPDGQRLALTSSEACELYDTGTWKLARRIATESASGLPGASAFSRDSRLLAFTKQRRAIKVIDVERGEDLAQLIAPTVREIETVAFSPEGNRLVAGTSDGVLQSWDLQALRSDLEMLQLNWNLRGEERSRVFTDFRAPERDAGTAGRWVTIVSAATLLCALLYSFIAWRRQRQFVAGYARIESLIDRQNKQLAAVQSELNQSQKMRALGTLAAGIGHDFNNLLSIIRMSNQLTAEEGRGNAEIEENSRLIEKAVAQGKDVVRSMLGYSRKAGSAEEYAPAEVLQEMLNLVRPQFFHGIKLVTSFGPGLPRVTGVRNRLEQVLLNLLVNASESMKNKGELKVSAAVGRLPAQSFVLRPSAADRYVQISIADSGGGIPEGDQSRIFEPFFTTKNMGATRGTGLGLSMVYAIAQEEGIGIAVESREGQGAAFRLFLPVNMPPKSAVTADSSPATVSA